MKLFDKLKRSLSKSPTLIGTRKEAGSSYYNKAILNAEETGTGCIVGTWLHYPKNAPTGGAWQRELTFYENGTWYSAVYNVSARSCRFSEGKYTVNGNKLTQTYTRRFLHGMHGLESYEERYEPEAVNLEEWLFSINNNHLFLSGKFVIKNKEYKRSHEYFKGSPNGMWGIGFDPRSIYSKDKKKEYDLEQTIELFLDL